MREIDTTDRTHALRDLAVDVMGTREMRELVGGIVPELIKIWAGDGMFKKPLALTLGSIIEKGFIHQKEMDSSLDLSFLLENPEFLAKAGDTLPELINALINALSIWGKYIETLPAKDRADYLSHLLSGITTEKIGELITSTGRLVNGIYKENPEWLTELLMPVCKQLIETSDFGELRETIDYLSHDVSALTSLFWEALCLYPAKVVSIMSALPNGVNLLVHFFKEMLGQISQLFMSPDMWTDFFLSLLRNIDGKEIGDLVNVLTEMVRQWSVGSALIGDPGTPIFIRDMSVLLKDIIERVDAEQFNKARKGFSEGRETVRKIMMEILRDDPNLLIDYMETSNDLRNKAIKGFSQKVEVIEDIEADTLTDVLIHSVSRLNTSDMAEIVNGACRTLNRMWRKDPQFGLTFLKELTNGIDMGELGETTRWVTKDMGTALKPLVHTLAPHMVTLFMSLRLKEAQTKQENVQ